MNNIVKKVTTEGISYIQYKRLLEFDNLFHAMTLKENDIGFNRKFENTRNQSIKQVADLLNITEDNVIQFKQDHTDNIIIANENEDAKIKELSKTDSIDGIITNCKNIASIITTADCIPIIIYDPKNKITANIHSGWKGTTKKIGIKAVKIMINEFNSNKTDLIFCMGPSIRKECFLVNEDVVKIYNDNLKSDIDLSKVIEKTNLTNDKGIQYKIDNPLIYKILLKEMGLLEKNIIDSEICTICENNNFHSRRAEGEDYQLNGNIVMLK